MRTALGCIAFLLSFACLVGAIAFVRYLADIASLAGVSGLIELAGAISWWAWFLIAICLGGAVAFLFVGFSLIARPKVGETRA
jgi:hypothetical protein